MPRATFGIGAPTSRSRSHNRQAPDLEAGPILEEQTEGADERTALLPDTPVRRPARIGSLYNIANGQSSNGQGSPHYLTLNQEQERLRHEEDEGRRSESILKLSGLIDDRGGEFERFRMSEEDMKGMSRKVKEFYRHQNTILDGFLEVDEILDNTRAMATTGDLPPEIPIKPSALKEEAFASKVRLAINVNFFINFVLLAGKVAVVLLSNSMSLIASTVDSAMDFLSTVIIFGTNRVIEHKSWKSDYAYPVGKRRMEPTGVLVFSVFMIASFLQVFIESCHRLLDPNLEPAAIPLSGIIVMLLTIVVKLAVWISCRRIKNTSVNALAQDAENDIVFNIFSLLFPYLGEKLGWRYLDPLGGALLSVYIIVEWTQTLFENAQKLTGKRAGPEEHQRVAYLLTRFSPLIKGIQHLSVYASGDHFIVETDVVLPASTGLTRAHNCAESAQYGLEQLEGVDRAFVHVDVSVNDLSGHLPR